MAATEKLTGRRHSAPSATVVATPQKKPTIIAQAALTASRSHLSSSDLYSKRVSYPTPGGMWETITDSTLMKSSLLACNQELAEFAIDVPQTVEQGFFKNIQYLDDPGCLLSSSQKNELFVLIRKGFKSLKDAVIAKNPSQNDKQLAASITEQRIAAINSRLKALNNLESLPLSTAGAQEAFAALENQRSSAEKLSSSFEKGSTSRNEERYSLMKRSLAELSSQLSQFINPSGKPFNKIEVLTNVEEGLDQQFTLLKHPRFKCSPDQKLELLETLLIGFMSLKIAIAKQPHKNEQKMGSIDSQISALRHQMDTILTPFPLVTLPLQPSPHALAPVRSKTNMVYCYAITVLIAGLAIVTYPYFSMAQK